MTEPPEPPLSGYPPVPPLAPPPPPVPPGVIHTAGQWPGPPVDDEPPRRRPTWVVALAVLAAVALLAATFSGIAAVLGDDDDDPTAGGFQDRDPSDDPVTTDDPDDPGDPDPTTPLDEAGIDAVVDELMAFVEAERGLPFLRDVTVELADDEEFQQRLLADFDEGLDELEVSGHVLQAVGLVPPGLDLAEALRSLLAAGVVGFYDTETDELVVLGTSVSPYVRMVMVHELVHALEDQHFELFRPELDDAPDEGGFGFSVLVEGSASRVEQAYRATFSADDEASASAEELSIQLAFDIGSVPIVLLESLTAPYILGPLLAAALVSSGGQDALDGAFDAPPSTSEAVLDPAVYLEGEVALDVADPVADGEEVDRHVLGAFGLAQLLGEGSFVLSGLQPSAAVDGWGGDEYVVWLDGERSCLRANLVGDTPADTDEIAESLADWAASAPFEVVAGVEVGPGPGGADVVTLTSCG